MNKGYTLMLFGAVLLFTGLFFNMVTLVVDDTAPVFGGVSVPADGGIYDELDSLVVWCLDMESGIKRVTVRIREPNGYEIGYNLEFTRTSGGPVDWEIWTYNLTAPIATSGTYNFTIEIVNNANLATYVNGQFEIYTQLQGEWYIAGTLITSTTQTIYLSSTTVTFDFIKTSGIEDSRISCYVLNAQNNNTILTLTYVGSGQWSGSYTFSPGTYALELVADDGVNPVTMSIVDLTVGETLPTVQPNVPSVSRLPTGGILFWSGIIMIGVGWWLSRKPGG